MKKSLIPASGISPRLSAEKPPLGSLDASKGETTEYTERPTTHTSQLQRRLGNRQVQLIAIGGSIGTATFVSIGGGLVSAGPAGLLIAYLLHASMVALVNNCMAEMAVFMPVSGAFIGMAGHWVDPALGFVAGWNFFLYEAANIPFEISAISLVLKFWRDDIPPVAVIVPCVVLYFCINAFAVKWFGESEFWLSTGKVILTLMVVLFTFVTMVGGNPHHDAYGFRYWRNPGPFAKMYTSDDIGHLDGFLSALFQAVFTIVGPEYVSMLGGETRFPREYLKSAFKSTYARFVVFFALSALCVGIVVPYNDPVLNDAQSSASGTATASPYVVAMRNLGIRVLPDVVSVLLITSIFSAGNAYTFYATRSLYGLALQSQAPAILRRCTKSGVPIYALCLTTAFSCLAFLNVSSGAAEVLSWFINLVTTSGVINYSIITVTFLFFYRAVRSQGLERRSLPYYGWFQPYCAYVALAYLMIIIGINGYAVFLPGRFDVKDFLTHYMMVFVCPVLFASWKLYHKTKLVKPLECDLVWEKPAIDEYEASFEEEHAGFGREIIAIFRLTRAESSSRPV